jgi:hypothetical protein
MKAEALSQKQEQQRTGRLRFCLFSLLLLAEKVVQGKMPQAASSESRTNLQQRKSLQTQTARKGRKVQNEQAAKKLHVFLQNEKRQERNENGLRREQKRGGKVHSGNAQRR